MPNFPFATREREFFAHVPARIIEVIEKPPLRQVRREKVEPGVLIGGIAGLLAVIRITRILPIMAHSIARNAIGIISGINRCRHRPLLEIGNAIDALRFGFGRGECREQERGKDSDDGDHHQQFDQGEGAEPGLRKPSWSRRPAWQPWCLSHCGRSRKQHIVSG